MKKVKLQKLIIILGPTASGKTRFGIWLAKKFNGEIISADSRQVYKEMNIGTDKSIDTCGISHHLIDVVRPNENFNVAIYQKIVIQTVEEIRKRKKLSFLVGGTGLYIKAIVDNVKFPKIPPNRKLRAKLENKTSQTLSKIYQKLDRKGAQFIDRKNKRRLIRAIEACKVSKKPFWRQRKKGKPMFEILQLGIKSSRETLKRKIEKRVEKMIKDGLKKEVENLVERYGWTVPLQTIGYQEWKDYFDNKTGKEMVKEKIIQHTSQFARRQMTWFRKDKRIKWIKSRKEAEKLIKDFLLK